MASKSRCYLTHEFKKYLLIRRKQIPDFPISVYGSAGGLIFSGGSDERIDPIICGGSMDQHGSATSMCYILNNDNNYEWKQVSILPNRALKS